MAVLMFIMRFSYWRDVLVQPSQSDLLSRFIDMCKRDNEGAAYTNKALRDMILNFIIAGRDTTAVTLSWFFYMMTCHPEVADKIVEELVTVTEQPAKHTQGRKWGILFEQLQFGARFPHMLCFVYCYSAKWNCVVTEWQP